MQRPESCPSGPTALRAGVVTGVLIVDDDHLMRAGLAELLGADATIDIVGQPPPAGTQSNTRAGSRPTSC